MQGLFISSLLMMILFISMGCQAPSSQSSFTNNQKSLPGPFELSSSPPSNESIFLSWTPSKNATGYKVLSKKKEDSQFQTVATLTSETSYRVSDLLYGVEYQLKISAFNNDGKVESETVSLILSPEPPAIHYIGVTGSLGYVSKVMNMAPALLDENGSPITDCSIMPNLPQGLWIHQKTCVISGTPTEVSSLSSYLVTAKNSVGFGTTSVVLGVFPSAPEINFDGASGTTGVAGTLMSVFPVSLIDNGGDINRCDSTPPLPNGLILDQSTCEIKGTPTVSLGPTNYTITATNSAGFDSDEVSLSISPSAPVLSFLGASGTSGNHGLFMSITPTTLVNNGSQIISCSSAPLLPQGLSVHPQTCVISGTPLEITNTTFTITATNAMGTSSSGVTLNISPSVPLVSFSGSTGTTGSFGVSMSVAPTTLNSNGASITSCSISPLLPEGLEINPSTCVIQGTPTEVLSPQTFTVTATNSAGSGSGEVILQVMASPPILSYQGATGTQGSVGIPMNITPTTLNPRGGEVLSCEASPSLPQGLGIDDSTCVISGTPTEILAGGSFIVTATNSKGMTSASVSISISPSPPLLSFQGAQGTQGRVGSFMNVSPTTLNHRGAIVSECTISPSLPQGLSINSSCLIGGIPWEVSPETSYTVTATNSAGSVNASVSLTVSPSGPILSYSGSPGTSGKVQEFMTVTPMTLHTGGTLITSCTSSPELPIGLTINSSTCVISGSPQGVLSSTPFTITVTNSAGSGTSTVTLSVASNSPALSFLNATGKQGIFGEEMIVSPTLLDERGASITNCTTAPALPNGVSIDPTTCVISGTPLETLSVTSFTVMATNSSGTGAGSVTLSVLPNTPVISFNNSLGTTGFVGQSMSVIPVTLSERGASITNCSTTPLLPSGLSIDANTCVISGVPEVTLSETSFSVTATNSVGTSSNSVLLTVRASSPLISYAQSSGVNGFVGVMMNVTPSTLNPRGGEISLCTISPDLPDGLSLHETTCKISGSPTGILSPTTFEVTATNSAGNGVAQVTLSIGASVPTISYSGVSGSAVYNSFFTMAPSTLNLNGASITSCTITPSLPSGLSIHNNTCTISGTPSELSPLTNYTVTVENSAGPSTGTLSLSVTGGILSFTEDGVAQTIPIHLPGGVTGASCSSLSFSTSSLVTTSISGVHPDCVASVVPGPNQNGSGTLTLSFNNTPSPSTTLGFSISMVDDAPVATAISQSMNEDETTFITLNYSDLESDSATTCAISNLTNLTGTCSCTSGVCKASVTGTSNYFGSGSFNYTVTANGLTSNSATASVTITAVDDPPVASSVSGTLTEDTQGLITLSYNDLEGHLSTSCTISSLSNLTGTCSCTSGICEASVTGTSNFNGTASFSYTVTANGLTSNSATASITVGPVDDAPVTSSVSGTLTEDTQGLVTLAYTDLEGHLASSCTLSSLSNLTGTCSCTSDTCEASVTGTSNFNGTASFNYTVTANGLTSNSSTATMTVSAVDDAPVAGHVSGTLTEDTSGQIDLSYTDTESHPATSCALTFPSLSSLTGTCSCSVGVCQANISSSSNFNGSASFTYTVTANGLVSNSASASVTVTGVNDAPVLSAISNQSTNEETSLPVTLSVTDVDSPITCSSFISATSLNTTLIPNGSLTSSGTAPGCTLTLNPALNENGTSTITVTASDGSLSDTKSFTLTVNAVDDAPVASNVSGTLIEDTQGPFTLAYSDQEGDTATSCTLSSLSNLTGSCACTSGTCQATVTGASNYNGSASFSYSITANGLTSNSADASITISAVDDAPVASNVSGTLTEDTQGLINLSYSDIESNTATNCTLSSLSNISGSCSCTSGTCQATVTGASNFNGSASFSYTITANGLTSNSATASVTITPLDDAPVSSNVLGTLTEDTQGTVNLSYSDLEGHTATSCTLSSLSNLTGTCACVSGTCTATVTGTSNFNGSASFSYTVTANGLTSNAATASITISAVDDAPVASNISATIGEDLASQVTLSYSDLEGHTATSCTLSSLSNLTGTCACVSGTCTATVTGTSNFNGSVSFSYTVTANGLTSNAATASITISAVDDAPVASNVSTTISEDLASQVTLSYSDIDGHQATTCTLSSLSNLTGTCACASGTCTATVTGTSNYNGSGSFSYTVSANGLTSNAASASITISAVNDAPTISSIGAQTTNEDTTKVVSFTISDVELSLDCSSSVSVTSTSPISSVTKSGSAPNCTLTVVPIANLNGSSSISVSVTDGSLSGSTSFTFTVSPVDDAPVASNVSGTISEDVASSITLSYADIESDIASACALSSLSNLTGSCACTSGTCTATVTGTSNYNGSASFSYTVTANGATSNTATASVTVSSVNDAPTIGAISNQSTTTGTPMTFSITPSDVDSSLSCDTSISITSSDTAVLPLASITKSGTFPSCSLTLTPTSQPGTSTVSVTVSDGSLSASSSFTLTSTSAFIKHKKIASRGYYTCAINNSGAVKCWGYGATTSWTASTITGLTSGMVSVDVGTNHACALTSSGGMKCWGNNMEGQLGNGTTTNSSTPVDVGGLTSGVVAIATGGTHSCGLLSTGELRCWGLNNRYQIGDGTGAARRLGPVLVSGLSSGVAAVSAGNQHTCALLTSGGVKCWGYAEYGQLGNNSTNPYRVNVPVDVSGLSSGVSQISAGTNHTCALLSSGALKCWGDNSSGQLGNGTNTTSLIPSDVSGLSSGGAFLSASPNTTCIVTSAGAAKCWGINNGGQVGVGSTTQASYNTPQNVSLVTSGIQEISSTNYATCALLSSGSAKCWGSNGEGDLGNDWGPNAITAASNVINFP